jgi:hypothetical protein
VANPDRVVCAEEQTNAHIILCGEPYSLVDVVVAFVVGTNCAVAVVVADVVAVVVADVVGVCS